MPQIFDNAEDQPEPCLRQNINQQNLNQNFQDSASENEQEDDDLSLNYDSATENQSLIVNEPTPQRPQQPERRYPARKRQAPIMFQYEEIVTKKPK